MRKAIREAKQIKNEDSMWELEHGRAASRIVGGDKIHAIITPSTDQAGP
jgi:hypothetical protein